MKEEIIDTKSMMKDINSQKAPTFQKNKNIINTINLIKSSKAKNNPDIQSNNRKIALDTKKTIINAFNK